MARAARWSCRSTRRATAPRPSRRELQLRHPRGRPPHDGGGGPSRQAGVLPPGPSARAGGVLAPGEGAGRRLVAYLAAMLADMPSPAEVEAPDMDLIEPVVAEWVVGSLGVSYDEDADRVVIVA